MSNRINHRFANNIVGSVDTFPIIVNRPKKNQSLLYNGKYKAHVYKVPNYMLLLTLHTLIIYISTINSKNYYSSLTINHAHNETSITSRKFGFFNAVENNVQDNCKNADERRVFTCTHGWDFIFVSLHIIACINHNS